MTTSMADDSAKPAEGAELSKDVLAPADGPRENLVATAVKFLQNPKVRQSPMSQKRAFLENKGLTSDEIQLAVQRAGVADETQGVLLPAQPQPQLPPAYPNTALVPAHPPLPPPLPVSPWTRTREILTTAAIVAAVSYTVYSVFKTYIRPWLMGKSETEARMQRLESSIAQLQASVAESNTQMVETLKTIQESLTVQRENSAQSSETGFRQETHSLNEIKSEVASLKALMLNRRQFPPPPVTSPIIPAWQKTAVLNSSTPSSPRQQESGSAEGEGAATGTQQNDVQPVEAEAEKQQTQSAEELAAPPFSTPEDDDPKTMQSPPEGTAAAASSSSSNNGFELVKPSSDSDTAADLD